MTESSCAVKRAEFSYDREEMLALYAPNLHVPDDLKVMTILCLRCQLPVSFLPLEEVEKTSLMQCVNSSLAIRAVRRVASSVCRESAEGFTVSSRDIGASSELRMSKTDDRLIPKTSDGVREFKIAKDSEMSSAPKNTLLSTDNSIPDSNEGSSLHCGLSDSHSHMERRVLDKTKECTASSGVESTEAWNGLSKGVAVDGLNRIVLNGLKSDHQEHGSNVVSRGSSVAYDGGRRSSAKEVNNSAKKEVFASESPLDIGGKSTAACPLPLNSWYFKDSRGQIQGPFPDKQMEDWFMLGFFTMKLPVRQGLGGSFVTLGDIIRTYCKVPFLAEPEASVVPLKSAESPLLCQAKLKQTPNTSNKQPSLTPASQPYNFVANAAGTLQEMVPSSQDQAGYHPCPSATKSSLSSAHQMPSSRKFHPGVILNNGFGASKSESCYELDRCSGLNCKAEEQTMHCIGREKIAEEQEAKTGRQLKEKLELEKERLRLEQLKIAEERRLMLEHQRLLEVEKKWQVEKWKMEEERKKLEEERRKLEQLHRKAEEERRLQEQRQLERRKEEAYKRRLESERRVLKELHKLGSEANDIINILSSDGDDDDDAEDGEGIVGETESEWKEMNILDSGRVEVEDEAKVNESCRLDGGGVVQNGDVRLRKRYPESWSTWKDGMDKELKEEEVEEEQEGYNKENQADHLHAQGHGTDNAKPVAWRTLSRNESEKQPASVGSGGKFLWRSALEAGGSCDDEQLKAIGRLQVRLASVHQEKQKHLFNWAPVKDQVQNQATVPSFLEIQQRQEIQQKMETQRKLEIQQKLEEERKWKLLEEQKRQLTKSSADLTELLLWCQDTLSLESASVDIRTLIELLKDVDSPYEFYDYVRQYLGESEKAMDFARRFFELKRNSKANGSFGGCLTSA